MRRTEFKVLQTFSTVTNLLISEAQKLFRGTNKNSSAAKARATASSKDNSSSTVWTDTNLRENLRFFILSIKKITYLLEDHSENVRFDVFDVNRRVFSERTLKQSSEVVAGGQQINLGAVHQLQNISD